MREKINKIKVLNGDSYRGVICNEFPHFCNIFWKNSFLISFTKRFPFFHLLDSKSKGEDFPCECLKTSRTLWVSKVDV